jgi:peptidyl-dipeptidase Dcp
MKWTDVPLELRDNPIFELLSNPQHVVSYDQIEPGHVDPAFDFIFTHLEERLQSLRRNPNKPSVKNTIFELESIQGDLGGFYGLFYILGTHPKYQKQFWDLDKKIDARVKAFESNMYSDERIFDRVQTLYEKRNSMRLSNDRRLAIETYYQELINSGVHLKTTSKVLLTQIEKRKAELSYEIEDNAAFDLDETVYWPANRRVGGIPTKVLTRAAKRAQDEYGGKKKGWLFDSDDLHEILKFAESRDLREKVWRAHHLNPRRIDENEARPVVLKKIHELIALQYEEAKLKGYKSFAAQEFDLLNIEDTKEAKDFLGELIAKASDMARLEREQIFELAHELDGVTDLNSWDLEYYKNLLRAKVIGFETEDLKPFFEFERVLTATLGRMEKIWGVQYVENEDYSRVHPSVKTYDVYSRDGKTYKGVLILDPFKRKGKDDGTPYCASMYTPQKVDGEHQSGVALVQMFYDEPKNGKPCLIAPNEIADELWHEMGHAMHHLMNKTDFVVNTAMESPADTVELPSMLTEYWGRQRDFLEEVAFHHKTGEPLHGDVIDAFVDSRKFLAGMELMERVRWCALDIEWHNKNPNNMPTITEIEEKLQKRYSHMDAWEGDLESLDFTHIFGGGYDAVFTGYILAEARAAEIFEKFQKDGHYDRTRLQQLRKVIEGGRHLTLTPEFNTLAKGALKSRAMLRERGLLSDSFNYDAVKSEAVEYFSRKHSNMPQRFGPS